MSKIIRDFKDVLSRILAILSLNDALITPEGRAFLEDPEKMQEFYKKLEQERKEANEKRNKY